MTGAVGAEPSVLVVDSSTVLAWVLQEQTWQEVEKFMKYPRVDVVLPPVGLTEVIFKARAKGNTSDSIHLAASITANGVNVAIPDPCRFSSCGRAVGDVACQPWSGFEAYGQTDVLVAW